jgi:hypothetical protein
MNSTPNHETSQTETQHEESNETAPAVIVLPSVNIAMPMDIVPPVAPVARSSHGPLVFHEF